ncbi:MAG: hypothetical protein AAF436_20640 [Myxococcota bacterium]
MKTKLACFVTMTVLAAHVAADSAPDVVSTPPPDSDRTLPPLSTELRFGVSSLAVRWSDSAPTPGVDAGGGGGFYWVPSLEARLYTESGHGATVGVDYRLDFDVLGDFCVFGSCDNVANVDVDFFVAHVGYAYRFVRHPRRAPKTRAWTFTPYARVATGLAFFDSRRLPPNTSVVNRSPLVGGGIGFDIDFHIQPFFFGWSVGYDLLFHTRGAISRSGFLQFNIMPVGRLGVVLGRRVQDSYGKKRRERRPDRPAGASIFAHSGSYPIR